MAFVAKINGQVVEGNSIAELSWLGCMISPGTNGNNNGNNNGNGDVVKGLLGVRKQDPEKCAKFKKWCVKQYSDGVARDVTVQEAVSTWGVKIDPGTPYRLYRKEYV